MSGDRKPSPEALDQVPYAMDRLREVGLDAAADLLGRAPVAEDRLERAVALLEGRFRIGISPHPGSATLKFIAECRGETPDETLARLRMASAVATLHRAGYFAESQLREVDEFLELGGTPDPRGPSPLRDAYRPWIMRAGPFPGHSKSPDAPDADNP